MSLSDEVIKAEKIRCVGRRISKPRLIKWTSGHRAIEIFVEGRPAIAEAVKVWRVLKHGSQQA